MNLAMQGCGTGAVLEQHVVKKLPPIRNRLEVVVIGEPGQAPLERRQEGTISLPLDSDRFLIVVGDSRQGWVDAYSELIRYSMAGEEGRQLEINVDVRGVRPAGERLKGFGGVANPVKLPGLFLRVASILNEAQGRKLTPLECCLLIDEAALVVVAGNVRRSAGMRQFSADDEEAAIAKANLWRQDENGDWHIDAERDALRMANHTRVFHRRPSYEEVLEAVTKQYHSGEGAIQFAPEAIARGNADVLLHFSKRYFIDQYCKSVEQGRRFLAEALISKDRIFDEKELDHRMGRYGLNPCLTGETLVWVKFKENGEQFEGFYTAKGLAEDSGSLQELTVMDAKGDWVPTRFECTDPAAEVWEITGENVSVVRGEKHRQSFSVRTTGNHAFFLDESLTPIAVEDLKVGDRLMAARHHFFDPTCESSYCEVTSVQKTDKIEPVYCCQVPTTHSFDLMHLHSHNCGEIGMKDNLCNLAEVHLNLIDPNDTEEQIKAFQAAALAVAALLNHEFTIDRYQYSREIDPIVGVSFTGLFDFFVKAFGVEWLQWWEAGRPEGWGLETLVLTSPLTRNGRMRQTHFADSAEYFRLYEEAYLRWWKEIVERAIAEYCQQHEIRRPNRCTTVQPAGSKSLLTNASPGWHPPKAQRFIRRMTFGKNDPIALACLDYGYTVVPSQSDKDENGRLLDDPFDPRCTEWLVEIPTEVSWANLPGADRIDISKFSAIAQFDFYMQVQRYYTTHNTSATIEYRENEIEALADCIYDAIRSDKGYVSAALLARFDASETFPRLPFEPITRAKYQELSEAVNNRRCRSFQSALQLHSTGVTEDASNQGPAQCDSDRCLIG
ncbi:hypothetical protein [Synechococcus elongatus]|uniref:hypothetical protein n=1 Tax=Synechococcus elongatus TaxID=32046 RepID=UPI001EDF9934|nr:hypothetical protein [Synechococcus elongatus]